MTRRRPRHLTSEGGFTLIEVLVTALIVVLLASATATALISTTHTSGDQRVRSEADALASQDQARLRGLSDEQLANLTGLAASHTATVSGTTFTVASSSAFQDASGASSCASTAQDFYKISTTVSWTEPYAQGTQTVSVDSMLSRPVVGILQTAVTDETGAALPGVSVAAAPATGTTGLVGQSGLTDTAGCAVFADMTAGSYTVTVSKLGYVDQTAVSAPSKPASVVATGTPAGTTFVLGKAGAIAATFKSSQSTAAPTYGGEADALSYAGSGTTGNVSGPTTLGNSQVAATAPDHHDLAVPVDHQRPRFDAELHQQLRGVGGEVLLPAVPQHRGQHVPARHSQPRPALEHHRPGAVPLHPDDPSHRLGHDRVDAADRRRAHVPRRDVL